MQSTVLISPVSRLFAQALLAVLAACCLFAIAAPRVQAAGLTEPQIQAILGLLASFGVDQAIVENTNAALRGSSATWADLKINGPDGPLALSDKDAITLTWTSR